jgi:hypothetical protein
MKIFKKHYIFFYVAIAMYSTVFSSENITNYCNQLHCIAKLAPAELQCSFFQKDFSYESIIHTNNFFSLFYETCIKQEISLSDEFTDETKIMIPFNTIVEFVDNQTIKMHEEMSKNVSLLQDFGQFICIIYCKILFELSRSFLYDIAFFYIQFSTIPLHDLFDIINILYQRITMILTEGGVSDVPTFLSWLRKRWFIPLFATCFVVISFLQWKGHKKGNVLKTFQTT